MKLLYGDANTSLTWVSSGVEVSIEVFGDGVVAGDENLTIDSFCGYWFCFTAIGDGIVLIVLLGRTTLLKMFSAKSISSILLEFNTSRTLYHVKSEGIFLFQRLNKWLNRSLQSWDCIRIQSKSDCSSPTCTPNNSHFLGIALATCSLRSLMSGLLCSIVEPVFFFLNRS